MNVCVFGAGNMGARIAEVFLSHDHEVALVDVQDRFLQNGYSRIENDYNFLVRKGKMEEARKDALLSKLKLTTDRKVAANADFVMEVILERMDLKK